MLGKPIAAPSRSFKPKQSSNVARVDWHERGREMVVTFKNGASHAFSDVPLGVYQDMQKAESVGSFFANKIKGRFTGRRLGTD